MEPAADLVAAAAADSAAVLAASLVVAAAATAAAVGAGWEDEDTTQRVQHTQRSRRNLQRHTWRPNRLVSHRTSRHTLASREARRIEQTEAARAVLQLTRCATQAGAEQRVAMKKWVVVPPAAAGEPDWLLLVSPEREHAGRERPMTVHFPARSARFAMPSNRSQRPWPLSQL